jgi:cytochrome c biogenesis protein CcmG, thiol:disulfide interchange protein DsbE
MDKANIIALLVIILVLVTAGSVTYYFYSTPNDAIDSEAKKTLSTESGLSFTDLDGNTITFDQFEGKVRVVNSWASWTPFSVQELKDLHTVAAEFKDQNVAVIAINRKESKELAVQFLSTIQSFENITFALDPDDAYYASIGGFSMPETVIYDAEGNLVTHKRGSMTQEEMRTLIREALQASN